MRGQERSVHNELSGVVQGASVQAAVVHGGLHIRTGGTAEPQPPWQLPPAVRLTDRTVEVERLDRHRALAAQRDHPALAAVSGLGGVGKTALALAWLHRLRPDFPGGQLYADLCAQAPAGPVDPAQVLGSFLRGLGVPPQQVPDGVAERAAMYRTHTADRRIVVLLDDAATAAQVRPLLPGRSNVTLVTSRRRMSGLALEGGYQVHLEPLSPEAAVELLAVTLADDRVATQPDDARALVGLCAGLPLAVRVAGARLAARPRRPITTMVRALTAERGRLDELAIDGDHGVRAALDLSYQGLPREAARLYRLLGVHPGTEFGGGVAAAVLGSARGGSAEGVSGAGTGPGTGEWPDPGELLDVLHDANLLIDIGEDRYRFHDLVRLHAVGKAAEEETAAERVAVFRRIADHYLATATRAERAIDPRHPLRERSYGPGPVITEDFGDGVRAALDWLERELPNLLAVIRRARTTGEQDISWQLADALGPFFLRRKHYDIWHTSHAEGLAAARELRDGPAECRMLTSGGQCALGRGDTANALEMFEEAARLFAAAGDELGYARTSNYRGLAHQRAGRPDEAAELFAWAAAELRRCGDPRACGLARLNAADVEFGRGRLARAAEDAAEARTALLTADDSYNAARATTLLGRICLGDGRPDEAERWLAGALSVLREAAAHYETARALDVLGEVAELRGQRELAQGHYREALDLYVGVNRPGPADGVRERLRRLDEAGTSGSGAGG
ncbi:tetratricopeptide repeat protein [Streptomyces sp. BH-SS-21]|uniref:Tetratricopeptide repeat protein n=1 Tax=Streptomyces liliiviolaceus TaxID=2823109 RepID=A0A940XV74_9ACTN|nr:tetratricopeptide repeat protein [Streptomyces liliiviolaceus]MBQ0847155.1 tetratricopeptide repeat protein [Streptomyces liliiviolaceus]